MLKFEHEVVSVPIRDTVEHNHDVIYMHQYGIHILSIPKYLSPVFFIQRRDDVTHEINISLDGDKIQNKAAICVEKNIDTKFHGSKLTKVLMIQ